jgi:hypothetical protein
LKFINGADLETLTLDQTGNLNITGKLSVKELCINNDCKNSWQVTSANINNMSNLISRIGSENIPYNDGYIPLFATNTVLRNSIIYQKANGNIGIGQINPQYKLDVNGDVNINGKLIVRGDIDASSNQWGACTWRKVDVNRKPKQWTCEAGEYVAGIGYEDNEWTNNNDIHIYPEVDQLYCCKI